jgi:hypothetical protein
MEATMVTATLKSLLPSVREHSRTLWAHELKPMLAVPYLSLTNITMTIWALA